MLTIVCMVFLLVFLSFVILFSDKRAKTSNFFDVDVTNCMRGFWCIIVLLVHIPSAYQNFIQDALGSFAYIGVTFFFMTSGYGLMMGAQKNLQQIKVGFWKRRLPKLLIPMVFINIIRVFTKFCVNEKVSPFDFLAITGFVRQLIFFYLLFWLVFKFLPKQTSINIGCLIVCSCVVVFSGIIYCWNNNPLFGWPVESFGFAYGILLARNKDKFVELAKKKWFLNCFVACVSALILGITYLLFKNITFIGDYIVKIVLGIAILLFILLLNTKFSFGNHISRFLGNISYEVYLAHDVVFIALAAIYPKMNSGIFVILSIIGTFIISMAVNKLSKTVMLAVFKKN